MHTRSQTAYNSTSDSVRVMGPRPWPRLNLDSELQLYELVQAVEITILRNHDPVEITIL
eukprot:COSAG01_NODE_2228_length_8130_cov_11.575395_9_plen_59_part_00